MADEVMEEKEWSLEEYLALFDPGSPDHALIRQRSAKLKAIIVRKVRTPSGEIFEDTEFIEKSGLTYTIRSRF
ncbi:MAG TPA: hypothetical protein VK914_11280 [bacterium]|jgi:hypothetical protein|nr:hypothetical protein [bacterium]